jgi:U1 small nuclear ribonucleoprotein
MTDKLPPNLQRLFAPRPPLPFIAPVDAPKTGDKRPAYSPVAQFLERARAENFDSEYTKSETLEEKRVARVCILYILYISIDHPLTLSFLVSPT